MNPTALPAPNAALPRLQWPHLRALMAKDFQLFEKQLAANVLAGVVALGLIAYPAYWTFYLGSLLLLIVLVSLACFSISNALLVERKEKTLAFIMSLPVSPLDVTMAKLVGNALTFLAPMLLLWAGMAVVTLQTPVPDGFIVFATLVFGHTVVAYAISLAVAMTVRAEGWNIFVMIASQVLINPFIVGLGQVEAIAAPSRTDTIVWSPEALAILGIQVACTLVGLGWTAWWHGRKPAFD